MDIIRHSRSGILDRLSFQALFSIIVFLLLGTISAAAESAPKRLPNAQPGDCMACHAGSNAVLPDKHMPTKSMTLKSCAMCHAKDAVPLKSKMPTSHVHMLSGISCQTCHSKEINDKTCTGCHIKDKLINAPAKGPLMPNPHTSHLGPDVACAKCHFQHKRSEFMCNQCHKFKNVTPSPLAPLSFRTKSTQGAKKDVDTKAPSAPGKTAELKTPAEQSKTGTVKPSGTAPNCIMCHSKPEYTKNFAKTKHGAFGCSACHKGITDISKHMQKKEPVETASCLTCHKGIQSKGIHATVKKLSCNQCHPGIHPREAKAEAKPAQARKAAPEAGLALGNCTTCHSGAKYVQHFAQTGHGKLNCTLCHSGITDLKLHMSKQQKPQLTSCTVCHKDVQKTYAQSYHAVTAKISCVQCHSNIHPAKPVAGTKDKAAIVSTCTKCHADQDKFVKKGHVAKLLAGNKDAPGCGDCHGIHNTPVFAKTPQGGAAKRAFYTNLCVSCHHEGGVAGKYGVFPAAVKAYGETYHGRVRQLGDLSKVAGCADCHTGHNILPPDNPASAVNPQALQKTCAKCHQGFHPRFVSYVPHPNPDDPKSFLSLYITKKFMIVLLAGVFIFFWAHSLLWWRKSYAEQSCLIQGGVTAEQVLPEEEGRQYVRRFTIRDRVMHVALILSFFGVVISGFPLKYPEASWARVIIDLFGSVGNAGLAHRVSAILMWLLFLYTCWLALKFLFPGFKAKGWLGRLFGPDSLFPRIKDIRDIWGMFKWFFNKGERPRFDRWTYWEKFDFLAVFWGMFMIGVSGIIMWIPEWSSYVMPGWMINIVHLAHSEEAFLAAVFIFTIHFFNNHLVPDKFPLERNIFTGRYTLEALRKERPEEYERILEENRLEEIKCKGPGTGIQLFAGVFGIASVLLGLALTVLIFWAVFTL